MALGWAWTFCFVLCFQGIAALNNFTVGGAKGWQLPIGSESYNLWAGNIRFQIGDTLLFKYDQKVDSVLHVSDKNYKTCNTTSPLGSWQEDGKIFKFDKHGPFYFISGNSSNCKKGEKLVVVVLAPCHKGQGTNCGPSSSPSTTPTIRPSPRTSPSPSPSTSPKSSPSSSLSPSTSPKSSPSPSPSPSPSTSQVPSPTPISHPSLSPTPSSSEIITPSSSNYVSPAPTPVQSSSSSSATYLVNFVIPLLLVALLKPNL